jgi:hypothetical protein
MKPVKMGYKGREKERKKSHFLVTLHYLKFLHQLIHYLFIPHNLLSSFYRSDTKYWGSNVEPNKRDTYVTESTDYREASFYTNNHAHKNTFVNIFANAVEKSKVCFKKI